MTPVFKSELGAYSYSLGVATAYSFVSAKMPAKRIPATVGYAEAFEVIADLRLVHGNRRCYSQLTPRPQRTIDQLNLRPLRTSLSGGYPFGTRTN